VSLMMLDVNMGPFPSYLNLFDRESVDIFDSRRY
jgi:hypothetical protein